MKPALLSKWQYNYNGQSARVVVVGIWGKGFADSYTVTAYELKQERKSKVDLVFAADMEAMITDGKLTYLAPGPDVPDIYPERPFSASASGPVRSEANERRREGEGKANKSRTNTEAGKHQVPNQIEFKTQKL